MNRALEAEFTELITAWEWDLALLQEVPPWWPAQLATAAGARARTALTSRNAFLAVRRALATRRPELARSNGGGSNAILVRGGDFRISHAVRLRRVPERRVAQIVQLECGIWVANFHASGPDRLARPEVERLWQLARGLAGEDPLVVGGDLNLFSPPLPAGTEPLHADHAVDHIFATGLGDHVTTELPATAVAIGERQYRLSDHAPVVAAISD